MTRGKQRLTALRDGLKSAYASLRFAWLDKTRARIRKRIARFQAAIKDEVSYQRLEQGKHGGRPAERTSAAERRSESDDEVRANIPPEWIPVFERVRRQIASTPNMTRTEAFEHYVHDHPEAVVAAQERQYEHDVDDLERQQYEEAGYDYPGPAKRRPAFGTASAATPF